LRATQIELQAGLCDERNVPGLQILQGVEQIEHRPAPAGEFCDQNGVDIAGLSQTRASNKTPSAGPYSLTASVKSATALIRTKAIAPAV
jgi:hypothetical protein